MSLIQNLIDDTVDDSRSLSSVLRRARVLAYRLGDDVLAAWADKEPNGYGVVHDSSTIPEYRKTTASSRGDLAGEFGLKTTTIAIPLSTSPGWVRERLEELVLVDSVAAVEQFAEGGGRMPWSGDMILEAQRSLPDNMVLYAAWREVSSTFAVGLLAAVRNRLLTFA